MKFVLFSDLHLDTPFQWAPVTLGRKLRLGLRETLERICSLTVEERAQALFCAGDLYEQENFTPDTAEYLRSTFARIAPLNVYIAPGNHDWYGPSSLYRRVAWSSNVRIFNESQLVAVELGEHLTLWGGAHRSPANTDDFLLNFHANGAGSNIALFHGSERGFFTEQEEGKIPHAAFREDEIPEAGLLHAFVGHFHAPRDSKWLTYAGSPQPLAFGEGAGRAVIIDVENGQVARRRIDVSSVAFNTVVVDVSGATSMSHIIERVRAQLSGLQGVARVILSGSLEKSVDLRITDVEDMPTVLDGLVVQARVTEAHDLRSLAQEQTVRGQFVRDVQNSALADAEKERVLTVGLRALDGRSDLEPL